MQNYKEYFKGKKITMLGLGLLGRGLNDAKFLAECGADLIVTDLKTAEQLKPTLRALSKYPSIKYILGEHRLEDFKNRDFILKAAGVPLDSPYIAEARENNIPIKMDASWFAELAPETNVIAVTGTRGKTTTTYIIYEILKKAFGRKIHLGGNIKGLATLPLLKKVQEHNRPHRQNGTPSSTDEGDSGKPSAAIVVMELDSWQLQGFGEAKISPHISVFTNLMSDHLNYYLKGSVDEAEAMQKYFMDKAQIFANQKAGDYLILDKDIKKIIAERYKKEIKSKIILIKDNPEIRKWKIKVKGEHNFKHILRATEAAKIMGLEMKLIKKAVEEFKGVAGRQEFLREYRGIKIYNDTTATTPDGTLAALKSLGEKSKKNIVLIMGGADKGLDMSGLLKELPKYCKEIFLLHGTGSTKLNIKNAVKCNGLKEAVMGAIKKSKRGDTLILSPAFASFGMFKNEYDRGDKFNALIKKLK